MALLKRLWRDQSGVIISTELILVSAVLGIGILVGIVSLRNQIVQEFGDVSGAIGHLDQSYSYVGDGDSETDECFVAGSSYKDETDIGDEDDEAGKEPAGISIGDVSPEPEGGE